MSSNTKRARVPAHVSFPVETNCCAPAFGSTTAILFVSLLQCACMRALVCVCVCVCVYVCVCARGEVLDFCRLEGKNLLGDEEKQKVLMVHFCTNQFCEV